MAPGDDADGARSRDGFEVVGPAIRSAIKKAATAGVRPFERQVLDAMIALVSSYSRLEDRLYIAQLAALVYGLERGAVERWHRTKVAQALRSLRARGIVTYTPARGAGRRSLVGLPAPDGAQKKAPHGRSLSVSDNHPESGEKSSSPRREKAPRPGSPTGKTSEKNARARRQPATPKASATGGPELVLGERERLIARWVVDRDTAAGREPRTSVEAWVEWQAKNLKPEQIAAYEEAQSRERRRRAIAGCPGCDDVGRRLEYPGGPVEIPIVMHHDDPPPKGPSRTTGVDGDHDDAVELLRDKLGAEVVAERVRAVRSPLETGANAQVRGTSSDGLSGDPAAAEGRP